MPNVFEEVLTLPDSNAERRYRSLVGLDVIKTRLAKEAELLLNPELLERWSNRHHGKVIPAAKSLLDRPPLFIFGGDVGTGKTTLAESFGDPIARDHKIDVRVYRLSLQTRGAGAVGEMTSLITAAFDQVRADAQKSRKVGHILIVDEADALAQSRDLDQMHHEDRAGVNALIRGVDQITADRLPLIVVMCSNRVSALDPAIRRRAAAEFTFARPNDAQRKQLFNGRLEGVALSSLELDELVRATGNDGRGYGYTYSDIVNRVIPAAVLVAYPDSPINAGAVLEAIAAHPPTRPFGDELA